MQERLKNNLERFENSSACTAVRNGLIATIPVLLIGIIALVLNNIPIPAYVSFVARSVIYRKVLNCIYYASFGMLSVFATAFIALSYPDKKSGNNSLAMGQLLTSLFCFFIVIGVGNDDTWLTLIHLPDSISKINISTIDAFGVNGLFCAILCATLSSWVYQCLYYKMNIRVYSVGDVSDTSLKRSVEVFIPSLIIITVFAIVCVIIAKVTNVSNFYGLYTNLIYAIPEEYSEKMKIVDDVVNADAGDSFVKDNRALTVDGKTFALLVREEIDGQLASLKNEVFEIPYKITLSK